MEPLNCKFISLQHEPNFILGPLLSRNAKHTQYFVVQAAMTQNQFESRQLQVIQKIINATKAHTVSIGMALHSNCSPTVALARLRRSSPRRART